MKIIDLSYTEEKVLKSISSLQASRGPNTRIKIPEIAKLAHCHRNTVWSAVNALEVKGILERDTKPRHGTLYRILRT